MQHDALQQSKSRTNAAGTGSSPSTMAQVQGVLRMRPRRPTMAQLEMSQRVIHCMQQRGRAWYGREAGAGRPRCHRD